MAFLFRLETLDGEFAEPATPNSAVPNFGVGDTIPLGKRTLVVIGRRDDDADPPPVLVVEDAAGSEALSASNGAGAARCGGDASQETSGGGRPLRSSANADVLLETLDHRSRGVLWHANDERTNALDATRGDRGEQAKPCPALKSCWPFPAEACRAGDADRVVGRLGRLPDDLPPMSSRRRTRSCGTFAVQRTSKSSACTEGYRFDLTPTSLSETGMANAAGMLKSAWEIGSLDHTFHQ
jgi:hypothetical protein